MAICGTKCVVVSSCLLLLGAAYLLNGPIPNGFKDPWTFRLKFAGFRLAFIWFDFMERLFGLEYRIEAYRAFAHEVITNQYTLNTTQIKTTNAVFDGIPVRIYEPQGGVSSGRAMVYLHGGGWALGSVDTFDELCAWFANELEFKVFSVEYRLAPEHIYPVPLDDCERATMYLMKHASDYNIDPLRVVIAGDSAGGNLAAAVSLRLRDQGISPRPKLQVLLYPCLQALDFQTPSYQQGYKLCLATISPDKMAIHWLLYAKGNIRLLPELLANRHTSRDAKRELQNIIEHADLPIKYFNKGYKLVRDDSGDDVTWEDIREVFLDPYFSPLAAADHSALPITYLLACEHDVLRDEVTWYAHSLKRAGNRVRLNYYEACFHGIISFPDSQDAMIIRKDIVDFINREL